MKKFINIFIGLSLFIMSLSIFSYHIIIGSDIPVNVNLNQVIRFSVIIFIYIILQLLYIIKSNNNPIIMNLILIIFLMFIWSMDFIENSAYKYHKYHTLMSSIGFWSTMFILFIYIFTFRKKYFSKRRDY
ncbi:hypothetical protein DFH04_11605 (plasmid) [Clostridium novyi]|nr:hypothetical protein DFH04_11605 [Clostridium novyi]